MKEKIHKAGRSPADPAGARRRGGGGKVLGRSETLFSYRQQTGSCATRGREGGGEGHWKGQCQFRHLKQKKKLTSPA